MGLPASTAWLVGILCVLAVVAPPALATAPAVALHAALHPERLDESTTVSIGFQIDAEPGQLPSPLTQFDVRLPAALHPERLAAIDGGAAGNGDAVLEEHAVELAALGHARHVGKIAKIEIGLADRVGMAPAGRMAAWNTEEGAEAQLAPGRRHWVTVMRTVLKSCS